MALLGSFLIGGTYGLTTSYGMTDYQWWVGIIIIGIGVELMAKG